MTEASRSYPRTLECGGDAVELNRLQASDRAALVEFVARLPTTDLLFVPRDINHPKVIDAWMAALQDGRMAGLAARRGGQLVGCSSIYTDPLSWSRHVGELRVLVASSERGRGLGRCLIQECFIQALELGYKEASRTIFEANVTHAIAGGIMLVLGSGPVRGFAVVLLIGIASSVFTAVVFTRMLVSQWVRKHRPSEIHI